MALLVGIGLGGTVAFNVWAIAAAYRSDSGLVTDDYYQKSLVVDPEDGRRARFARLGWEASLIGPATDGTVQLALHDRSGAPLAGAQVSTVFFRKTQAGMDRSAALAEAAPGVYRCRLPGLVPGAFEARFRIRRGAEDTSWYRSLIAGAAR